MQIRVLGCAGSIAAGSRTTSFLLDDDILIDAGTGVGELTLEALSRVGHIFLSHSHLDHVLGIPLLVDSVIRRRQAAGAPAIQVHGLPQTLQALRDHVFNGVIWPDFTRLPSPEQPMLSLQALACGEVRAIGGRCIEALPACHSVPAVGYAVRRDRDGAPAWVYTGDTGPNPALWSRLASMPLAMLVIETAFGDEEQALAEVSRHLHPTRLHEELRALSAPARVFITHIKPGETDTVMQEIGSRPSPHRIEALQHGQVLHWD
jgi:ribonuclease BN (tRNA processing enzyme)